MFLLSAFFTLLLLIEVRTQSHFNVIFIIIIIIFTLGLQQPLSILIISHIFINIGIIIKL